jgi:putative MATE family efflux protein
MRALSTTAPLAAAPPVALPGALPGAVRPAAHSPRTLALLQAPILRTLLRLAGPNVLVMLAQSSTGLIEAHFVGRLGTPALAGMALVFPGIMLMQMMSSGAMGGGISSAIARALGAGRRGDADILALHAMAISLGLGLLFCAAGLLAGPALYRAMGGEGAALAAALQYSNVVFGGAVLVWGFNGLASCIRGTGDMLAPALVICGGALVLVPLSPCLIFGWGPFPALGVAGGGVALLLYYAVGGAVLAAYLCSARAGVRLRLHRLRWAPLWAILRVGLLASLVSLQTNLVVTLTTAFAGGFGAAAIAGYGAGSRLEFLRVPLVFGLGAPLVALVGTNLGAGQRERALRVAWVGAGVAFLMTQAIGLAGAMWPAAWLGLFGQDPAMLAAGATYLRATGPFFGFFGGGMALYFASQGAGRLAWPLAAAVLRMAVAVGGGWLALRLTGSLQAVFLALGAGLLALGVVNAAAIAGGAWFRRDAA